MFHLKRVKKLLFITIFTTYLVFIYIKRLIYSLQNRTFDNLASDEQLAGGNATYCYNETTIIYVTPLLESDYILALCYVAVLGVALLIGTFGNVIIIIVTSTTSAMNKVGKHFVINLAVSDLCVSGIAEPMCIVGM